MRPMRRRGMIAVAFLLAITGSAGMARACGLDGVPSLHVNGVVAQRMTSKPSRAALAHWAPFIFPGPYRPGVALHISENVSELKRSLPADAFSHPWRWSFGDGTTGTGFTMRHTYRHSGE